MKTYYAERLLTLFLICVTLYLLIDSAFEIPSYSSFEISEWLINYQAGFVRRGLFGEILFNTFNFHPFSVKLFILYIEFLFFFLCIIVVCRFLIKLRYSLLPILLPFSCNFTHLAWYRRDFLVLCLFFITIHFAFLYYQRKNVVWLFLSVILCSLTIIIYEPSFFIMCPLFWVFLWGRINNIKSTFFRLGLIALASLPLLCMFLTCFYKGNPQMAVEIWHSWNKLFLYYPEETIFTSVGLGVDFIGWNICDVYQWHLNLNFDYNLGCYHIIRRIIDMFVLIVIVCYIVSKNPRINNQTQSLMTNDMGREQYITSIILFQLMMMLPMLTLLSTDFGRNILFIIFTTYIIVYYSEEHKVKLALPYFINSTAQFVYNKIMCYDFMNSKWLYLLMILLMPLKPYPMPHLNDSLLMKLLTLIYAI